MKISLEPLTRVGGSALLEIIKEEGSLKEVRFAIRETPRLMESLLIGKSYKVLPEITARICGICPIAYQITALQAVEEAFEVKIPQEILSLRKLLYFAEWIHSHTLHLFFVHLPDYFKLPSFLELYHKEPFMLEKVLYLRDTVSLLIETLGGRTIHPVALIAGGFSSVPESLSNLQKPLEESINIAVELFAKLSSLKYPEFSFKEVIYVSLIGDDYPLLGDLIFDGREKISKRDFRHYFKEIKVPYATANFYLSSEGKAYLVGPLARFNNAFEKLSPIAQSLALKYGVFPPLNNPYRSALIRMLEILHSLEKSLEIVKTYRKPPSPSLEVMVKESEGFGVTEAPRGILWHHYKFDSQGTITYARLITPTAQNLKLIELTLTELLAKEKELKEEELLSKAEPMIRNFDPCLPCATHFLEVKIKEN
ncbi:MAG: nickel-dependent hydrogenase large subunit [Caldimicrobium sp.]|nr:nickel-dependent hydrogenase large subunit [Caldimicrobium sp.]